MPLWLHAEQSCHSVLAIKKFIKIFDQCRVNIHSKQEIPMLLHSFRLEGEECVLDDVSNRFVLNGSSQEQDEPELTIQVYYPKNDDDQCHVRAIGSNSVDL